MSYKVVWHGIVQRIFKKPLGIFRRGLRIVQFYLSVVLTYRTICQTTFGFTILYLDYLIVIQPCLKPEGGPKVPRRINDMSYVIN